MGDRYDVAGRLAEGRPALDHTQTYVQACHALGYQQPDLTSYAAQVGDWYTTEAGLDLRVLDGDATELRAAVTAVEEALWVQRTQVTDLAAAWRGAGAESAARFLQRHCDAADEVAAHVRAAAEQCAILRDDLWQAVDGKVATTVAVDERHAADRPTWLAAAHTVAADAGDRSAAELVIRQQVMPFVDNDIRHDWLAAISAANASVAASYDAAIHALSSTRDVRFDIPGDLGPRWHPVAEERATGEATPTMSLPATPSPIVPAVAPASDPAPREEPSPRGGTPAVDDADDVPVSPLDDLAGLPSGAGGLGGLGGTTGGAGGVLGSLVDSIGSLLGSLVGGAGVGGEPIDLDDADGPLSDDGDEPVDRDEPDDADKPHGAEEPAVVDDTVAAEPPAAQSPSATGESVAEPAAPPADLPPPATQPPPSAAPEPDGATPCEIAEDQLPQVGQ